MAAVISRLRQLSTPVWILVGMVAMHVAVYGHLKWAMHANYGTFGFDMGIYDQGIWLLSKFENPFVTVRGLHLLANHVDPIWLLFVPFYWLGAGPIFLSVVQTAWIAAGAIPLWLIGRDGMGNEWRALALPAAWLLNPSLIWINWFHFHPEALAATPLLFAWWFATRSQWRWMALSLLLAVATKESVAMAVFMFGLVVAWRWNRRIGLVTTASALVWFFVATRVIIPLANDGEGPHYTGLYGPWGDSAGEIAMNVATHPGDLADTITSEDRQDYYQQLLAPLGGVPLLAGGVLVVAAPQVLVNVISTHSLTYSIRFQYSTVVVAVLFLAAANVVIWRRRAGQQRFLLGLVLAAALASNVAWAPSPVFGREFSEGLWAVNPGPDDVATTEVLSLIPDDAGVSATYSIVPQLTHRTDIYEWPNPFRVSYWGVEGERTHSPERAEWLVLRKSQMGSETSELLGQLLETDYQTVVDNDHLVVAQRRSVD
ncbi:MAG TPA: DUF2079 domain-containing protein [Acidimicrobiales bacterium]